MTGSSLGIAIAGLGTVGAAVAKRLREESDHLRSRCGRELKLVAVSARDRERERGFSLADVHWCDDARDLVDHPGVDVVVELIGGESGIALDLARKTLESGTHLVTANKAMLAVHGTGLATLADAAGLHIGYEASVAGGIPIVKALREGLAGNRISRIYGILNGTSNYVMTAMREHGSSFADVLGEAQKLGYAEADPSLDIGGGDAAHKLSILASLAFSRQFDFANCHVEGIANISPLDIAFARELGYRIKLLGLASQTENGIEQRVHPCMVPEDGSIAHIGDVLNAVVVEGDAIGSATFVGPGAGGGPTASAVLADLIDIAHGLRLPMLAVPVNRLASANTLPIHRRFGAYYLRLMVIDQPGVIADVTAILRDAEISVDSFLQRSRAPHSMVPVVITTHEAEESAMQTACQQITDLPTVMEPPCMIRVEQV